MTTSTDIRYRKTQIQYTSGSENSLAVSTLDIIEGDRIETLYYNSALTEHSNGLFVATDVSAPSKAGNCPDEDGYFYDANGIQFRNVSLTPNVKQWGAIGDDSNDDTQAVQSNIHYIEAVGRGEIFFWEGTYKITSQLTAEGFTSTSSGVAFKGQGRRISILKSYLTSGTMLFVGNGLGSAQQGFMLSGLGFESDISASEDVLVRMDFCVNGIVENCNFLNGKGTQLHIGRPQNVRVNSSEFYGDAANTVYNIRVGHDSASQPGQGCCINYCVN